MAPAKIKTKHRLTPEKYLKFERKSDTRHGFLDGEMSATAGESLSDSKICVCGDVSDVLQIVTID